MIYIVISTKERSTKILTDHITKKKYFTDLALAQEKLRKDFSINYTAKTNKTLTQEEFNSMKGKCTDWYGISNNGGTAWLNDINGVDYDIQILSIEE